MKINHIVPGSNTSIEMYQVKIDNDTVVTYGYYKDGSVFSEVYKGSNYVVGSSMRSYSRIYKAENGAKLAKNIVPSKYSKYVRAMYDYSHDGLGQIIK